MKRKFVPAVAAIAGVAIMVLVVFWQRQPQAQPTIGGAQQVGFATKTVVKTGPHPVSSRAASATAKADFQAANAAFAEEARAIAAMPRRSNPQRFVALNDLAARWMKHDPAGALAFLAGLTDFERRRAGQAALLAWFERDPSGVLAFVKTMVRRDESVADYLQPIFERLAFDGATLRLDRLGAFLKELPSSDHAYEGAGTVLMGIASRDPVAAAAFGTTLPVGKAREELFFSVGFKQAELRGWSVVDELMARPAPDADDRRQISGALGKLVRSQFAAVVAWLKTQPRAEMFDEVRGPIIQQYEPTDPETAVRTAVMMSNEQYRIDLAKGPLVAWLKQDFGRAKAWAITSDLPEAVVAEAIVQAEIVPPPKPVVDYASRVEDAWRSPDQKAGRRQLWGDLPDWLEQDRPAALKWMAEHARSEEERQFFDSQIRRVPTEKPPPPKPGEGWDY